MYKNNNNESFEFEAQGLNTEPVQWLIKGCLLNIFIINLYITETY